MVFAWERVVPTSAPGTARMEGQMETENSVDLWVSWENLGQREVAGVALAVEAAGGVQKWEPEAETPRGSSVSSLPSACLERSP